MFVNSVCGYLSLRSWKRYLVYPMSMGQEEGHFQIYLCETLGKEVNKERNRLDPLAVDSVKVSLCTRPTLQHALKFL